MTASPHRQAIIIALIAALGGLIFGLDAVLISGGITDIRSEFKLNDSQIGWVVSSAGLGVLPALLVTGMMCDHFGRKVTLIIIAALYLISAVTSCIAPSYAALVAARILGGFAFTSLSVGAMYIGEISPAHLRGKLVSILQMSIVVGLSLAFFINYGLYNLSQSGLGWVQSLGIDQSAWRWMLGAEIIPALIWLLLLLGIPQSPRWLTAKGRIADAKQAAARLHGQANAGDIDPRVMAEYTDIETGETKLGLAATLRQFLTQRPLKMAAIVGLIIAITQPITAINVIFFYSPIVFEQIGSGTESALVQSIIIGLIGVVSVAASMFVIDRIGRRPLFLGGLVVAGSCLLICAYCFSAASYQLTAEDAAAMAGTLDTAALQSMIGQSFDSDIAFKAALVDALGFDAARAHEGALLNAAVVLNAKLIFIAILGFIAAFQATLGPILWVLFSEIFPTRVRGVAITFFAFITGLVNLAVTQSFPSLLAAWGASKIFLFYGCAIALFLWLNFIFLPETKNKTIEDIEKDFAKPRA